MTDALAESGALLDALQQEMQKDDGSKKVIGQLIGKVRGTQKRINSVEMMNWVPVGKGSLSIGHRPAAKLVSDLKLQNTTHILTLLSEHEGGKKVKGVSEKAGIEWLWFPMVSATPPGPDRYEEIDGLFRTMEAILQAGSRIYIHCSAGIHRTGMITYGFLRYTGLDAEAARQKLEALREVTSEGVGADRLEWGDTVVTALKATQK